MKITYDNKSSDEGVKALNKINQPTTRNLENHRLGDTGVKELAESTAITSLNLSFFGIASEPKSNEKIDSILEQITNKNGL